MKENKDLGYLGSNFQIRLINQILKDKNFGESIIGYLQPNYFDNQYFRLIIASIKNYFQKYGATPGMTTCEEFIRSTVSDDTTIRYIDDIFREIKNQTDEDFQWIQQQSIKFCRQQEIKKAITEISSVIKTGDETKYDKIEDIFKKALDVGMDKEEGIEVFHSYDEVLRDDYREPIPTGISGLDDNMGGGLGRGELGLFIASLGTGKSSYLTKVANTAYNYGNNVVQIIFEDNPKAIQRKHYACWTGIELNELGKNKEKVINKLSEFKDRKNKLIIKKFPSYGVSTRIIKKYLGDLIKKGIKPDMVIIDYVECLVGENQGGEEWQGEGRIMRQIESMSNEMNFACWVASQGGRSSISSDVVTVDKMSGNIKKAQIGHFIVSVAKSLKQKELGLGTMAILKSRFGRDGLIFKDCVFDNGRMIIDTTDCVSFMEFEEDEKENFNELRANRAKQILQQKKQLETV
jgi:KaiC/GvpD/RAD55 family RecA-like ATPase